MWNRKRRPVYCMIAMLLLAACSRNGYEELQVTDVPIMVNTSVAGTKAYAGSDDEAETGENVSGKLFFWYGDTYDELCAANTTKGPSPYFTYLMNDPIASFGLAENRWIDTGYSYIKDMDLYATGYAPRNMLVEDDALGFRKLHVEADRAEDVIHYDFLSCDAEDTRKGSLENPFGSASNELIFRHLTSKILVVALRHETMTNQVYVRKVQVDLSLTGKVPFHVPKTLEWRQRNGCWGYEVTETTEIHTPLELKDDTEDMIMVLQEKRVDSCYVCQPADAAVSQDIAVNLNVQAEYSYVQNFASSYLFHWSGENMRIQDASNPSGYITRFEPGYIYIIYLNFYKTGILITAEKAEWEDGGIHYVPVVPSQE